MITVKILKDCEKTSGFDVSGHSGYADEGSDIVCAAVSSAVGLCESVINDSFKAGAEVLVDEKLARVLLRLPKNISADIGKTCAGVLSSFESHMAALAYEYPAYIKVLEVQSNA